MLEKEGKGREAAEESREEGPRERRREEEQAGGGAAGFGRLQLSESGPVALSFNADLRDDEAEGGDQEGSVPPQRITQTRSASQLPDTLKLKPHAPLLASPSPHGLPPKPPLPSRPSLATSSSKEDDDPRTSASGPSTLILCDANALSSCLALHLPPGSAIPPEAIPPLSLECAFALVGLSSSSSSSSSQLPKREEADADSKLEHREGGQREGESAEYAG
eukprot:119758-Rhodomonas_salina.1